MARMRFSVRALAALALCAPAAAHGDHARVLAELERREAAAPRDPQWALERAALLRHVGRGAHAVAEARRGLALSLAGDTQLAEAAASARAARLELARSLGAAGASEAQARVLAAALREDPTAPELHELEGGLALARGAHAEALDALDRALRWSATPSPDLVLLRARIAWRVDRARARAGLEDALARFGAVPAFVEELQRMRAESAGGSR